MKSLEKLRELACDMNAQEIASHSLELYPSCVFDSKWLDSWHDEFDRLLDEIEREIAERYMELPVDADGVPIHVGDELYNGEVIAFGGLAEGGVVFVHRGFEDGNYILEAFASNVTHHVKPRTLEDVLFDCYAAIDYDKKAEDGHRKDELLRKYAAEIRDLMVVDR